MKLLYFSLDFQKRNDTRGECWVHLFYVLPVLAEKTVENYRKMVLGVKKRATETFILSSSLDMFEICSINFRQGQLTSSVCMHRLSPSQLAIHSVDWQYTMDT